MTTSNLEPAPIEGADPQLYNADLAPTPESAKTWSWTSIAALWVGMVVCVPTYMLSASMVEQGMAWWQATLTVLLGNAIVLVPMMLIGHAGTKHGIPFPVLLRSSFGTIGANVPAILRGLVACGWFGIQTWVGGSAIYTMISFKMGGYITAGLGLVMFPWKILESSEGYIFIWLVGYSALLGPIAGILVSDYFLVRRTEIDVPDLFRTHGKYRFHGGWNWRALVALGLGVFPNVPGFLAQAGLLEGVGGIWTGIYTYAWFVGFFTSLTLYAGLMWRFPPAD